MYNWDPRDPRGMMFAYPVGENKDVRETDISVDCHTNDLTATVLGSRAC